MKQVVILALKQALASSMTIPLEMISAAGQIHQARHRQRKPVLKLVVASEQLTALTLTGGITLTPSTTLAETGQCTLIFVPALWGNPKRALQHHASTVQWLQNQHAGGATICSVGTGSYFPAEAGLLDHCMATTHWHYFDDFARRYRNVRLLRRRFITQDNRIYCTGSINAVRDVMLHFVEQLYDPQIADEVSRHFTHELKRSYESRLLALEQQNIHHDELIIKIQEWLQRHYARQINMSHLAHYFGLNQRTFNRRFRQATGQTPSRYLQSVRMGQARALLKHSNLGIAETAFAVGYQDVSHFTGLFRKMNAVTPGEYRRLVRTKVFTTASPDES